MKTTVLKLLNQHYFTLINLILLTSFIGFSTGSGYKIMTSLLDSTRVKPTQARKVKKATSRKNRKKTIASYDIVAKRNLFKSASLADLAKKDAPPPEVDLEVTDLKLTLWGTIVAGPNNSRAIIEEKKSRKQALYKIGDSILTASVKHILRNKVVLTVNGKDEILEIEQKTKKGRSNSRRTSSRSSSETSNTSREISVKRSLIDESMKNLNELMKDVRIRPHFKNGEADGLIVSGIKSGSVFKKLGLRNGDIIMGVDGSKIESVDDAMKLYSGLKDMENMKVDIKRRGRVQTLNFNIE